MHADDLLVNDCAHWHAIEDIAKLLPQPRSQNSRSRFECLVHQVPGSSKVTRIIRKVKTQERIFKTNVFKLCINAVATSQVCRP